MSIEIKGLTHVYNKGASFQKKALDNVSLKIDDGEFVGLIGHTGSGKSTLIQHLNALLQPTEGTIFIDGVDINADKKQLKAIRQNVGLVFQYPEHQLFMLTVYKDVAFGPENMGISQAEVNERVVSALEMVGLSSEVYEKSPFELSGGQKRRVAIAGILAMRPKVLVLDEPTAGLDPRGREELFTLIKQMHKKMGNTVVLVSHSMEDISRLVDRIIVMHDGKVFCTGTATEVFRRAYELEKIGLMAPQISYLMNELKQKGFDVSTDIFTVEGAAEALLKVIR